MDKLNETPKVNRLCLRNNLITDFTKTIRTIRTQDSPKKHQLTHSQDIESMHKAGIKFFGINMFSSERRCGSIQSRPLLNPVLVKGAYCYYPKHLAYS